MIALSGERVSDALAWHGLEIDEVAERLESSTTGISSEEAARRLAEHGPNEITALGGVAPWQLLLAQFKNVLIVILLLAVVVSGALGHVTEAVVITVIVLLAVVLGFVQEYRAERAVEALRELAAPTATVLRDGDEADVPAREVVPGDIVLLRAGDKAPADARLLQVANLQMDESALTGESVPVSKRVEPLAGDPALALGDRKNMVYAGTAASYGRGSALVVATGMETEFGGIAQLLETIEQTKTPLQKSLDRVGVMLARVGVLVVVLVIAIGLVRDEPFLDMLLFGVALAVAVVPEALPAVITISLTLAAQRMVKRNALIRRLSATETLGSVSVICSDKTGTLTRNEMTVREILAGGERFQVSGAGYDRSGELTRDGRRVEPPEPLLEALRAGVLASDAELVDQGADQWRLRGDPTEGALLVAAAKAGLERDVLDAQFPRQNEIPFTSEAKRMTTLHETPAGTIAYAKGAPEVIIGVCTSRLGPAGEEPLDDAAREELLAAARRMAAQALRVLAVARRAEATLESAESGLTFLGLIGMIDPPRPEAKDAVATCRAAGIRPVMITGDHPLTAEAIARELGILSEGRAVTGAALEAMSDTELERDVETISVYARVSPIHKLRVVQAWQSRGHTVAMTGDGVNDAPALKTADIGVAMGIAGTDVAKEAAAITLTDDNFASIVAAVEEGRGVFANIKKYLMYLLAANLGEIVLLFGASVIAKPLPLSAVQILYINLATDGLPALALSVDPAEPGLMRRAPRSRRTGIFNRPVVTLIVVGGIWSGIVTLTLFSWALSTDRVLEEAMTLTFVTLVLIEFFKAYGYRSERRPAFRRPFANKWLNLAVAWELGLLLLVVNVPFLQDAFETTGLTLAEWALAVAVALTILPVLEIAKLVMRRRVLEADASG